MRTLASNPSRIDVKYLEQFPEFIEFRDISKPENGVAAAEEPPQTKTTPEEAIELAQSEQAYLFAAHELVVSMSGEPMANGHIVIGVPTNRH